MNGRVRDLQEAGVGVWSGLEEMREGVAWSVFCVLSAEKPVRPPEELSQREAVPGYTWRIPSWAFGRAHVPGPGGTCKSRALLC
jgi:hypothetical protein